MVGKTWAEFYSRVCGSRELLEGNILANAPFITEIAKYVKVGDRVLEIGSGTGVLGYPLAQAGVKVVSIDNDPEILKMALLNSAVLGADIEFREADAFHLPFFDREFRVAFSQGFLEHFSNQDIGLLIVEEQRVADVVVVSVPLKGNRCIAFGDERWMTMVEWEELFLVMGVRQGFIYGSEPSACFTFIRVR